MAQIFFITIILHSFTFLGLTAANDHILFPNQKLAIGHTLISQNQAFEMGFFSPGRSLNRFLGIWYKNTPDVVVWVANRNNAITPSQSQGVVFMISGSGNLVISRGKSIIWSASSPGVASNPVLHLLDTGNLVLADDTTEGYIWQSFHYPTDTMLPGMNIADDVDAGVHRNTTSWRSPDDPSPGDFVHVIENWGLPELVILRGTLKTYRFGQWNGMYFSGALPSVYYIPDNVFREERLIYAGELHQGSVLRRATLDTSGSILYYTMNARKDKWNLAATYPEDTCDAYSICGPNGFCRSKIDGLVRCQCLRGFSPKFQEDWNLQDWSGGCTRSKPLNCTGGDGFLEVRGVKYPAMFKFQLSRSMSLGECRGECLKNCNCTAYANPFITNGDNGCLMWHGDLIDTKELSAAHSKQNIYIRVPLSEQDFSADLEEEKEKEKKRPVKLILISMASGILVSAFINVAVIKMATIVRATNNFSRENMIGVGGFGPGSDCGRHGWSGKKTRFWS